MSTPLTTVGSGDAAVAVAHPAAVDPLALVAAVVAALLVLGWSGPLVGALVGVVMVTLPGALVVGRVGTRDRAEHLLVVMAMSLVTWLLIAHVLLTVRWWQPRVVVAVAAASFALACTVSARPRLARPRLARTGATPPLLRGLSAVGRSLGVRYAVGLGALVLAWGLTLSSVDLDGLGDWGLVTQLPVLWLVAWGAAVWVAARVAVQPAPRPAQVVATLGVVLVMLYATVPLVSSTLRYPWTYKHLGVVRLLDSTGRLHPEVDIYNNVSGMFGMSALVRGATGVDPESYAAWAQLVGQATVVLGVWVVVHRLTEDRRVAHLGALVFVLTDWVGQNYFSAQLLGTFFAAVLLGLVVSWFAAPGARRIPRLEGLLARLGPPSPGASLDGPPPIRPRAEVVVARRAVVAVAAVGLALTHTLTSATVTAVVVAAALLGWVRDRVLLAAVVAAALVGVLRAWPYFGGRWGELGFGGSVAANAAGNVTLVDPPWAVAAVGWITKGFAATVWLLAAVGLVVGTRAGRRLGLAALFATVPLLLPVVQSYGGEAVYRVYLYALPGMAALVAVGLVDLLGPLGRRGLAALGAVAVALGAGFVVVHFGRELQNHVDPSEVAVQEVLAAMPDRQLIGAKFADWAPVDLSARYPMIQVSETWTPTVTDELDLTSGVPVAEQLDEIADDLVALTDGTAYVALGPGMVEVLRQTGSLPIGSVDEALQLLTSNPRYVVVTRIDDSVLLRVLP